MNDCSRFEAMLEAQIADELRPSDARELFAHCETCEACRDFLLLHGDLERLADETVEPDERDFSAMSANVLARIAGASSAPGAPATSRLPVWKTAVALAASVLLFAAGRFTGRGAKGSADPGAAPRLVAAMGAEAASNHDLADVENSRYTYSNVTLRSAGEGQVLLDFDVTTHVRTAEPAGSALAREVIVQALLDPSSTGARLRALSYAGASLEQKVREAMMLSLRRDPSLAVRLKALELLCEHLDKPDVEAAVLAVLRDDESVQMRLLALDSLAEHRIDRDRIREVIHEGDHPGDEALLVRLAQLPGRL